MTLEQIDTRPRPVASGQGEPSRLLALGRGAPLPTAGPPIPDLVAEYANAHPGHVAVESGGQALSYGQIDAWANRVATRLAAAGVGPGSRVGLLIEPSTAMVAAALGIMRAGAAYVPLDQAHPDQRIADVLADARLAAAVVASATEHRLAATGLPLVRVEDAIVGPVGPRVPVSATDAAYLIYTSGSTGEPKGVLVEHAQLAASTLARRMVYPGRPVFLLVSPAAFDSSVAGLWGTLTAGGRLVIATADEVRDPEALVRLVDRHRVTRLLCVPSLYRVLLDAADRVGPERLRSLESVIVAGEALPEALVRRHFAGGGTASLVNEYGPTEATVWASYHRFAGPGPVSIGGPVPGARLYVLDEFCDLVEPGEEGELYIGGAGVARGYFGRPAATADKFLDDPFADQPGARMYRTGDQVRWTAEGTLEFLGRRDHQVKVRGHRVELGAVEAALRAVPGVRDAVVVPDEAMTRLIGFAVVDPGTAIESLRDHLASQLPAVMVPSIIRVLNSFPLSVNGKVDRNALAADASRPVPPDVSPAGSSAGSSAGHDVTDGTTAKVAAAWAEVLGMTDVPADVNFFDLGGQSMAVFQLQDALESRTGSRPSVVALFRHTTVAAQAALIRDGGAAADESHSAMRDAAARRSAALRARRQRAEREAPK